MDVQPRTVEYYRTAGNRIPFREWLSDLHDRRASAAIDARIARLRSGNLGACRALKDGVWELKVDVGAGYRVYFAEHEERVIILLCGGDKRSQTADIRTAKRYWADFRRRTDAKKSSKLRG